MYIVIMAGGSGTRFWPFSRKAKPKQFLAIVGKNPMVVETWNRVKPLSNEKEGLVVLGQQHLEEARRLFDGENIELIAEPVGRNTAACIGLGALYADCMGLQESVAFLPADHYIADTETFLRSLKLAGDIVKEGGIATLGIVPTRPETGYGYIHKGSLYSSDDGTNVYEVSSFVEKPDLETALKYLESGEYYWNAGIFLANPRTILKEIEVHLPDLHIGLQKIRKCVGKPDFDRVLEEVYPDLPNISFDYGIMEKTKEKVLVIPCDCGWSDVGSWLSLYELKKGKSDDGANVIEGDTLMIECRGNLVASKADRFIACLGIENSLIVDTPDALLVADKSRSQEVRKIVEYLKKEGRENLL